MSKRKVQPFLSWFSETCKCQTALHADVLYQILPKLDSKCGCTDGNTLKPLTNGFHLMKLACSRFLWTSPVPSFIQNLQKSVENMDKLVFRPWSKIWLHCTDFYKTHSCSVALHGDLHHISLKWIKKYGKYRNWFLSLREVQLSLSQFS
jgi:hypothetical protein